MSPLVLWQVPWPYNELTTRAVRSDRPAPRTWAHRTSRELTSTSYKCWPDGQPINTGVLLTPPPTHHRHTRTLAAVALTAQAVGVCAQRGGSARSRGYSSALAASSPSTSASRRSRTRARASVPSPGNTRRSGQRASWRCVPEQRQATCAASTLAAAWA
jgi:hypothetical protein